MSNMLERWYLYAAREFIFLNNQKLFCVWKQYNKNEILWDCSQNVRIQGGAATELGRPKGKGMWIFGSKGERYWQCERFFLWTWFWKQGGPGKMCCYNRSAALLVRFCSFFCFANFLEHFRWKKLHSFQHSGFLLLTTRHSIINSVYRRSIGKITIIFSKISQ